MAESSQSPWKCESEEVILDSKFVRIVRKNCVANDTGHKHPFYVIESQDWANIIPITEDGKIVMIRQYRIGIDGYTWEVPGGVVDDTDSNLEAAAIREMEEETGYVAVGDWKCEKLGWSHPNPAFQNNKIHSYLIGPVKKSKDQNLDPGERIEAVEVDPSDIHKMIQDEVITHSLHLNSLFLLSVKFGGWEKSFEAGLKSFLSRNSN